MQCLEITMHLVLVVLLQVASLLLASANDITKAKDAFEVSLQFNETTRLEADLAEHCWDQMKRLHRTSCLGIGDTLQWNFS